MTYVVWFVAGFFVLEAVLRFIRLRLSPLPIRLAYALFLLSEPMSNEQLVINQRIRRGGFQNEAALIRHYALISGKSEEDVKTLFFRDTIWKSIWRRRHYSGGHGVIEEEQQIPLGRVARANQRLKTMTIDANRNRCCEAEPKETSMKSKKKCVFLGGSVMFGLGATSDMTTIPARVRKHLADMGHDTERYEMVNCAYMGFTSFQELQCLMQYGENADYVIALSGYNEIDQAVFSGHPNQSMLAKSRDEAANRNPWKHAIRSSLARFYVLHVLRRFVEAFKNHDDSAASFNSGEMEIYPLF